MLVSIGIFSSQTAKFRELYPADKSGEPAPETRAIAFCMNVTGVSKLFSREDYYELLFRLAISLQQLKIVETFFGDDYMFSFNYNNQSYAISHQDLVNHIGLHIYDAPRPPEPFDNWVSQLEKFWNNSIFTGFVLGMINPAKHLTEKKRLEEDDEVEFTAEDIEIHPSVAVINNARIMADSAIKDIPDDIFEDFVIREEKYLKQIQDYIDFMNSPPPMTFDWNRIPAEKQRVVLELLFPDGYTKGATLDEIQEYYFDSAKNLVYLAWLFANGFVYNAVRSEIDPRFNVDISVYDGLDGEGGINLQNVFECFDLESVLSYLKEG